jgi:putative redox protein
VGELGAGADREVTGADQARDTGGLTEEHRPTEAAAARPPNLVRVKWAGGERFDTGRPGGPTSRIDGTGQTGQGMMDALLSALAACSSVDVVGILTKRRTPPASLDVEVVGTRADTIPRRLKHVLLKFRITGQGIERVHAERAIDLALNKYCSVRDSLDRSIPIEWELELGE